MSKTLTKLLAGAAALTLVAGAGAAVAQAPQDAARQAAEDASAAAAHARETHREARDTARDARDGAREARRTADEVRREVRIYRGGDNDKQVFVFRGGDREDHLRTMLQLRADQEPALKAYLEAVGRGGPRGDHMVRFDRRGDSPLTTPERLVAMEARMAEQQTAMRQRIEATKTFYGQLDDKQKKVFDSMPILMFAGPGFGPTLLPVDHRPPTPPAPPKPPML
ncbi:MAG: hypothetical protein EPN98_12425 [Phenylobacterium sp.]|uniref:Spy/CpxP family protein refolding chaperone n=1 Tax=Phenylobacterium sp. TaxID=1871053 RepID=UPI00120C69FC|nr:Spy/CpxP family protein refolding chaperone [Phenylobacterium sp.]TAL32873.1 MAG: hypothetical protein EPN98_12425 [Phenylobacterium sp.]